MRVYQVKFMWKGEQRYGLVVPDYEDDAKKYAKQGKYIVQDAILPKTYAIPMDKVTPIEMSFNPLDEYQKYVDAESEKAAKISDALPGGIQVGAMFSISVADGGADYVITKVNKKTCQVEWRGFGMDRYTDHHFGWGGKFPIAEVARYVRPPGIKPLPRLRRLGAS